MLEPTSKPDAFAPKPSPTVLPKIDPRNVELWNRAANAYGTAEIFRKRARHYRQWITAVNFIGIAIPLTIGAIALANLFQRSWFERAIYFASVLVVVQGLIFLWSIVANWPDSLDYSAAASTENLELSNRMAAMAPQLLDIPPGFDAAYAALIAKDDDQIKQDFRRDIRDGEKIYGYRAGRLRFQRRCWLCKQKSISMNMPLLWWNRCRACGGPLPDETGKQSDQIPPSTNNPE
jgi:mobilome CxxCx(11)CxxC protein